LSQAWCLTRAIGCNRNVVVCTLNNLDWLPFGKTQPHPSPRPKLKTFGPAPCTCGRTLYTRLVKPYINNPTYIYANQNHHSQSVAPLRIFRQQNQINGDRTETSAPDRAVCKASFDSQWAGPALVKLIVEATSHPSLFAFSEILSVPNLLQLQGTESSVYIDLLRLFAHGTWTDYKSNAAHLPQLVPDQAVKLKQLSVLTLAEMNKVLSYDQLLKELEVANVRELEDFLINECMYVGIVKGKLNQLRRCFEVQFAAGRDLRHGQLENMMQSLTNWFLSVCPFNVVCLILIFIDSQNTFQLLVKWGSSIGIGLPHQRYLLGIASSLLLDTSDNVLSVIQDKIKWAETMCEEDKKHKMEVKSHLQDVKKSVHSKLASNQFRAQQDNFFFELDGEMDSEEDLSRSKRKRSPKDESLMFFRRASLIFFLTC
ncbi:hypothetical protein CUMW_075780, partial [Citrus unshiu]